MLLHLLKKVEPTMIKMLLKIKKRNKMNKKIKIMMKKKKIIMMKMKNTNNGKSIEGLVTLSAMLMEQERQKNNLKQN